VCDALVKSNAKRRLAASHSRRVAVDCPGPHAHASRQWKTAPLAAENSNNKLKKCDGPEETVDEEISYALTCRAALMQTILFD